MKFNWRFADFTVYYKKHDVGTVYPGTGVFRWLTPTGAVADGPYTVTFPYTTGEDGFFGMPYQIFAHFSDDTYTTTVHRRPMGYEVDTRSVVRSYIYGCRHASRNYWVPFHIFKFNIPRYYSVTYQRISPTPEGYIDAFGATFEGVLEMKETPNPRTQYPQPEYPPY